MGTANAASTHHSQSGEYSSIAPTPG